MRLFNLKLDLNRNKSLFFGFFISLVLFFLIEISWPYAFLKDDNLNQFLPVILEGMKQIFSGTLPVFNQFQATGLPILEYGTYNVLYPPMILSYIIANYLFGNSFYTIEIFVLFHILFAYLSTFLFLTYRGVNKFLAVLGSLAFVFSGYVIIATSSWYYVIPTATFLPLILYLNHRAIDSSSKLKFYAILGLVRGLYFYAGNTQFFIYSLFFEMLYFILYSYNKNKNLIINLEKYAISILITFALVSPLAFGQISLLMESSRLEPSIFSYLFTYSAKPIDTLLGQIFPYPIIKSYRGFANSPESFTEIYYYGTVFFIFALIGIYYTLRRNLKKRSSRIDPLLIVGVLSFLLSLGWRGLIYFFGFFIPLFKSFIAPFRFTIFTIFFISCFGVLTLSNFLSRFKIAKKYLIIFIFLFFIIMAYHTIISSKTAWSYPTDDLPLNFSLQVNLSSGRTISLTYPQPKEIKLSNLDYLMYNIPTYFQVYHIAGYESFYHNLIEKNLFINRPLRGAELNLSNLAEYGVKFILLPTDSLVYYQNLKDLEIYYRGEDFLILTLNNSRPFVFSEDGSYINYRVLPNGFNFYTNFSDDKTVIVNTIYRENYEIKINGVSAQKQIDGLDRIRIYVPRGNNFISVIYRPKYFFYGLYSGFSLLLLILLYIKFLRTKLIKKIKRLNFLFNKKNILLIILLFLIVFFVFSFYKFFSIASFKTELRSVTGLNFDIEGINIVSIDNIVLHDLKLMDPINDDVPFYSESVILDLNIKKSLLSLFNDDPDGIYFEKIFLNDFYFNTSNGFWDIFYVSSLDVCNGNPNQNHNFIKTRQDIYYYGNISMSNVFISPNMPLLSSELILLEVSSPPKKDYKIFLKLNKFRRRYYITDKSNSRSTCLVVDYKTPIYSKNNYLI